MGSNGLSDFDRARITAEGRRVRALFEKVFLADERFLNASRLLGRYSDSIDRVLSSGWSELRAVNEAHNELSVADALLKVMQPRFSTIRYEPVSGPGLTTIDFRCESEDAVLWIDVKTIQPSSRDRWDQFERVVSEKRIPPSVEIELHQDWLGGELWHNKITARSRMLEHSIDLERKIECCTDEGRVAFALALCGSGFHWHVDELEDFVAYYHTGQHRMDDGLAAMEDHYLQEHSIKLSRKIGMFSYFGRSQTSDLPDRLIWEVKPPPEPWAAARVPPRS